jgi:hypothetical protein
MRPVLHICEGYGLQCPFFILPTAFFQRRLYYLAEDILEFSTVRLPRLLRVSWFQYLDVL